MAESLVVGNMKYSDIINSSIKVSELVEKWMIKNRLVPGAVVLLLEGTTKKLAALLIRNEMGREELNSDQTILFLFFSRALSLLPPAVSKGSREEKIQQRMWVTRNIVCGDSSSFCPGNASKIRRPALVTGELQPLYRKKWRRTRR